MYPSGWRSLIGIPAIGWSDPGLPPPLLAGAPPWRSRSSWPPSGEEQGEGDGPVAQTNSGGRDGGQEVLDLQGGEPARRGGGLSLIHISEPTRLRRSSYAVFCLKK